MAGWVDGADRDRQLAVTFRYCMFLPAVSIRSTTIQPHITDYTLRIDDGVDVRTVGPGKSSALIKAVEYLEDGG